MCLCSRHWILAIICLKECNIFILDPLDIDESTYKEFINCIQR
jgi:Ulp1 family protease